MKIKIEKIKVGNRVREDVGEMNYLEDSIKKIGLLHPILIDQNYQLLSGQRRLKACQNIGLREVDVSVVNVHSKLDALEIESHENFIRKNFTDKEIEILVERKSKLAKKNFILSFFCWIKKLVQGFFARFRKQAK